MAPFNSTSLFDNARFKLRQSHRMQGILKILSIRRRKSHVDDEGDSNDVVDNDDQSSIGNPVSPADSSAAMTNISDANSDTPKLEASVTHSLGEIRSEGNVSDLFLLPQELFDNITSYLTHANIVCLALVNKELMSRFLHSCTELELLDPSETSPYKALNAFVKKMDGSKSKIRGSLLSLLDYDLLDLVYCYKCKVLHDPFLTFKDRAFAPRKAPKCIDWSVEHHMPSRATRKLLRTITKHRIHGAEYRHLLQQVNNTQTSYQKGFMVQYSLRIRYRDDDLILRKQQVVSSIDKSVLALWLFRQILRDTTPHALVSLPRVYPLCNHRDWNSIYAPMVKRWTEPFCTADHSGEIEVRHLPSCFNSESFDASKQDGHMIYERLKWLSSGTKWNHMDVPALLGDVLGCRKCTTDYSIDVVPLPEPFNWGFILTTWLDVGKIDFCKKWDSHRDPLIGRGVKRDFIYGDICERFEDITSKHDYRPKISELNIERMHNYGWSTRAMGGKEKYINWSSGHTCNPQTGQIEDPDPLDEADY
ncbi:hypothetical protein F5Y00DRAFT_101550 [Daldinia vernicosa]|uniref:uncharacterized protein n=1 Tax=Daldinia vernicosa TaxID=114800 RepID=UPI002008883A|nr:uncharacterized protein F5Y00DRAFT_101550 [Daldinia vernicosa]KAI0853448.1 hypothetical protein F5Y00DRAFT_101550 [Daldinia vernicosa]